MVPFINPLCVCVCVCVCVVPDVTVKLFGSSKSLFSLKSSNVNLFLDFPEEHVSVCVCVCVCGVCVLGSMVCRAFSVCVCVCVLSGCSLRGHVEYSESVESQWLVVCVCVCVCE